jgi:hypothetical protein
LELCRRRHNSKERRLEPQITLGLLTDASGFPLAVEAFEGNKAETATMLPVINAFKAAHQLTDATVVADAEPRQATADRSALVCALENDTRCSATTLMDNFNYPSITSTYSLSRCATT